MKSGRRKQLDQTLIEPVRECKSNGYLLSSKKIGSGAFSKVYLGYATHEKLVQNYKLASDLKSKHHAKVAIKIIATSQAPSEYHKKFLPREIYSLNATYKHTNVIQLYESFRNDRRSYLILELASQGDLLEYINNVSSRRIYPGLEEGDAKRLFRQLINAVAHCHSNGIVHRDLKCENILLDDRGFVKLTDFGFASQYSMSHSLMNTFCGSVAYTAPEILLRKKYNGVMSDVWSLGVILFAMVTGKLPFKERQPFKMLHLIRQGLAFNCPVSRECKDLVRSLLQWKPSARPGLQQVVAHCWMIPAVPSSYQNILVSVGALTDQGTNQEQQQKGKKPPSITLSPKNNTLKALDSSSWLTPISLTDNKKPMDRASKKSGQPKPIVQLLSPIQQDDKQSKNPRIFLYRSGTCAPPNLLHNLPNLQMEGSVAHLSSSHSSIKTPRKKMTKGPMVISKQSEQRISLYPMAAIGKGLASPWNKGNDPPRQTPWLSRPKT